MHVMFLSFSLSLSSPSLSIFFFLLLFFFLFSFDRVVCTCSLVTPVCVYVHACVRACVRSVACNTSFLSPFHCVSVCITIACLLFTNSSLLVSLTSTVFLSLSSIQRVCGTGSVCTRAQICACRLVGDREFWMDLERSEICQGDGMGRYRFRKGGTSRKTLMEKCISSITTQEKQRGSILETGTPFSMYMFVCTRTRAKTKSIYEIACDLYARTLLNPLKDRIRVLFFFFLSFFSAFTDTDERTFRDTLIINTCAACTFVVSTYARARIQNISDVTFPFV